MIAVFERSAYVEATGGLACIGDIGNGPLNASSDSLPRGIGVGDRIRVDLAGAVAWKPLKKPHWDSAAVSASLHRLGEAVRGRLPGEGFGELLDPARERPAHVDALAHWLASPLGTPSGATGLIGLGPGLTPSGDDLVGGAICALHASGRREIAVRLSAWALPLARDRTNRISQAHLACAAEGECSESIDDAIVALLSGGSPDLERIDSIGHTSGWDALAGAVLALQSPAPGYRQES